MRYYENGELYEDEILDEEWMDMICRRVWVLYRIRS